MAIVNPNSLYSAGQGILRDDVVSFIANQEAKKRARQDATNQFFTRLPEKLNLAGVRQQDLEDPNGNGGILKDIESWKNNWRPNLTPMEQQQHLMDLQKIRLKIDQSKNRAKNLLTVGKSQFEGKFSPRHSDLEILDKMNKSIYDPTSYKEDGVSEYNPMDLSSALGQFTPKDQMDFEKAAIGLYKPQYDPNSKAIRMDDSGKILLTKKYKPEHIAQIANQAAKLLSGNKKLQYHYEDLLEDPNAVKEASENLSKLAGTSVVAQTPEQMAAGLMIGKLANVQIEDEEKDVEAANRFRKQLQDDRIAAQLKRLRISETGKNARVKTLMDGVEIEDVIKNAAKKGIKYPWKDKGEVTLVPLNKLDPIEVEDILGKYDKQYGYPIEPYNSSGIDYIVINPDGTVETPAGIINPDRVKNNTYNRTKGILKAEYKKEIKPDETKVETLAEKMRRLKNKK